MPYDRQALVALIRRQALQIGQFTLSSGKQAHYYLDCRLVTLDPQGANLVAEGILERLAPEMPDAIGGLVIGADPITASVVTLAGQRGLALRGFLVRKEAKGHGAGRQIEGPVAAPMRVAIVEDVVTSGGSALRAAEVVEQAGMSVARVLAVVDRLEGGAEEMARRGYRFESLLTIRDLGL